MRNKRNKSNKRGVLRGGVVVTPTEILATVTAAGIRLRAEGDRLVASPRECLTDELRSLIRGHRAELLATLSPAPAHAGGPCRNEPAHRAPEHGADCMCCANLRMTVEVHTGTRRVFWWRCERGHVLLEGRNFGEWVLLAPPECDQAGDFRPWRAGQR